VWPFIFFYIEYNMDYIADKIALTALSNNIVSLGAYKSLSNVPQYGVMLKAFCMFYSLIDDNNRVILENYINTHLSVMSTKYKMLLLLCQHVPTDDVEKNMDVLAPVFTVLNVNKSDGLEKIKEVLNTNFSKILNLLEEKHSSLENILTSGFDSIKKQLTIKGGKSKKNKRKYKRSRRVRKMV
jgi:hypothetical protein